MGSSVTALWRGNDNLNIFITGADGVVWQSTWDRSGNGWADWSPVRTESKFAPGAPITAIARDDGHMDLFISDTDGAIWSTWWDVAEGTGWHPWFGVDNSYKVGKVVTVTAMWNGTSRIDLAVVDEFGYLMTSTFEYSKGWQGWYWHFDANPLMSRGSTPTSVWRYGGTQMDMLCVGSDGQVHYASNYNGKWDTWNEPNGGGSFGPKFVAGTSMSLVSAFTYGPGVFATFIVDENARILFLTGWDNDYPRRWLGYYKVPTLDSIAPGQHVTAIETVALHVDLYIVKTDGTVWNIWYDEPAR